ncbi:MAG: amidoligase family protein, partial [Candidatus Obscuribacterales bacterium]|nr:amidoligase family protein [Candidatus Obscuribacterales bacterium]
LEQLLSIARKLQFRVPHEGATHIHFDATSMQSAHAIANLVNLFTAYGDMLKVLFGCNPNCRRLGNWPDELIELVNSSGFRQLSWTQAQVQLKALKLTKYCDLNLVNCIHGYFDKNTIEVRILPVWLETTPILQAASLFVAIFKLAQKPDPIPRIPGTAMSPESIKAFSKMLSLADRQVDNPKL